MNYHQFELLLKEAEGWWEEHDPTFYSALNPGVSEEELQQAEQQLGFLLPKELKLLYLWHNGEADTPAQSPWAGKWMTLDEVVKTWQMHEKIFAEERDWSFLPPEFGGEQNWWKAGWIPFMDYCAGDAFCLDTTGSFDGRVGQIINFVHDDEYRTIEYENLYQWFLTALRWSQEPALRDEEGNVDNIDPLANYMRTQLNPGYPRFFPPLEFETDEPAT